MHRRKSDDLYKDTDDIRENIINYEDEGGGEGDMTGYDLNVLRLMYDGSEPGQGFNDAGLQKRGMSLIFLNFICCQILNSHVNRFFFSKLCFYMRSN